MKYLGLLGIAVLAYGAGIITYYGTLVLVWRQRWKQDLEAVAFWSGLAYVLVALPLYLISFLGFRLARRRRTGQGRRPAWFFSALGAALGVVPTYAIVRVWGGGLATLATPEASLFYFFFIGAGICFGSGWWWLLERDAKATGSKT